MPERALPAMPPGTIVLQDVSDTDAYAGVVVDAQMFAKVSQPRQGSPNFSTHHVCLVLGYFSRNIVESIFGSVVFPYYHYAPKKLSFPYNFEKEIELLASHEHLDFNRGPTTSYLLRKMFAPTPRQYETIALASFVQQWVINGGGAPIVNRPVWMQELSIISIKRLDAELREALVSVVAPETATVIS